ncbi:helix-turn-helix transcriptional regulator [Actinocorallia aurantiaca]
MVHGQVRLDGAKLRNFRLSQGLTLDRLAALTGGVVPARQLGEYEAGRRNCDPLRIAVLSLALDIRPEDLSSVDCQQAGLADLRHWAGLTADEASDRLGMSRWSLRRAERTGRLPASMPQAEFITTASALYGRPKRTVEHALRNVENINTSDHVSDLGLCSVGWRYRVIIIRYGTGFASVNRGLFRG